MEYRPSPPWRSTTKRIAAVTLIFLFAYAIYLGRGLLVPLLMSLVVAYVLLPIIELFQKYLRLPRNWAIGVVYIILISILIAIPANTIPRLINQINEFAREFPNYLLQVITFFEEPIVILGQEFDLSEVIPLDRGVEFVVDYVPTVGVRSVNIFGSLASATLSTVGWILVVLFVSFYMVKDHQLLFKGLVSMVPEDYQSDMYHLGYEISGIWNSFLRGQLILFAIMGTVVFTLATIIGLPNALLLGLISGLVEFLPQIGATLAMIPAVLIAFVQHDQSWLGSQMSPFLFAFLVMVGYIILQQIENYWLVPRVIGRSLNMHPMIVFVGALAGAGLAGVLGILLASPVLASSRVIFRYIRCKLVDEPPFPDLVVVETEPTAVDSPPKPDIAKSPPSGSSNKLSSEGATSSPAAD